MWGVLMMKRNGLIVLYVIVLLASIWIPALRDVRAMLKGADAGDG